MPAPIRIGTRGSKLALYQVEQVRQSLKKYYPQIDSVVKIYKTLGDHRPDLDLLTNQGRGIFCGEIERALREREIDLAVHSVKDLPGEMTPGLCLAAYLKREDPREVLVSKDGLGLAELPGGARVGTSSLRRLLQLRSLRPDLNFVPIRGNVETRVAKVQAGDYDATILALAGLRRLGMESYISEYFAVTEIIPAPGQGCIGVQIRAADQALVQLLERLNDPATACEVRAERAFLTRMGGNCETTSGAYAKLEQGVLTIRGLLGDSNRPLRTAVLSGKPDDAERLGRSLAEELLGQEES